MAIVVYVINQGLNEQASILYSLKQYTDVSERVIVVHEDSQTEYLTDLLSPLSNIEMLAFDQEVHQHRAGYRQALLGLFEHDIAEPVILTGSHVFGPVFRPDAEQMLGDADLYSSYWHNTSADSRFVKWNIADKVPYLDFAVLSPRLLNDPGFRAFWQNLKSEGDPWLGFLRCEIELVRLLERLDVEVIYPFAEDTADSADPRLFEIDALLRAGSPVMPVAVVLLDPLLHDLNSISFRGALDWLRQQNPELYSATLRFVTRHVKLREFATIADQYEVISDYSAEPDKSEWAFGDVAVFIHAFYAEMMPEFWTLIERLPCRFHLFLTTATDENAEMIAQFLVDKGLASNRFTVRVVEQNRGRDMSSLFITWRDIILEGQYEVALRLHSKRTPQVARQVGNSFRDHLFENLVRSPGYVRGILDRMEAEPDVGLVIPPVIHVGFGTLGHSWYNNKPALAALAKQMYIDVPLDDFTPVTAYGTMYWFRTDALLKMFRWQWKWEDYNAEPHHIDGGLAHVQERLIGYCVQDAGYRILQVMNPDMVARNYAKLEYKLQLFSAYLGSNNAIDQHQEISSVRTSFRGRTYRRLRETYGALLRRFPASRRYLLPFKNIAVSLLTQRR